MGRQKWIACTAAESCGIDKVRSLTAVCVGLLNECVGVCLGGTRLLFD